MAIAQPVTYNVLAPIVASRCSMCHSGPAAAAELRLDSLEGVLKGSRNGPVVRAGQPANSELIRRLKGASQPRMPMTGPPFLSDEEIGRAPATATYADVAPIFATRCAK